MKVEKLYNIEQHEIEKMIRDGRKIFWKNNGYEVIKDNLNQFLIKHHSGNCVGLESEFIKSEFSNDFLELVTEKYIILDWAGNLKFNGQEFDSFDEAWEHVYEFSVSDPEEFQVILKTEYKGL